MLCKALSIPENSHIEAGFVAWLPVSLHGYLQPRMKALSVVYSPSANPLVAHF